MRLRTSIALVALGLASGEAHAAGRVLDGTPVSLNSVQNWCIAPTGPIPNWDGPAHPECQMTWKVLSEKDGRVLYSARYAWPSPTRSKETLRVLTEVLFEGARGSRVVHKLYAVQDDEAQVRLAPLRLLPIGGAIVIEAQVCMGATRECGRELVSWTGGRVEAIEDLTVADIRAKLPENFDLRMNPEIDLMHLSGRGGVWAKKDRDCCPSAEVEFSLRLTSGELRVDQMKFQRRSG